MKRVQVNEVRAMLKEIMASTNASPDDVSAVLTIGTPAMGLLHLSGPSELSAILAAVEHASPAEDGTLRLDDTAWHQLENSYSRRVVTPLFA
ncbi:MAG TPA: hypothetical protein VLF71_03895 [Candidatus Saccharimonadales bacterium]|nr:hypothetical protein [Candidatus Saccharimonadales bacterium]